MAASKRPPWLRSSDLRFHRASTRPLSKKGQEDGPLRGRHPVGAFNVSLRVIPLVPRMDAGMLDDILAMTMMGATSYVEIVLALDRFGVRLREDERSNQVPLRRDVQRAMWERCT